MIRMVSEKSKKQDHHWTPSRLQNSSCSIKHRPQFNLHKTSKLCKSLQRCYTHTPTPTVSHTHINGFISRQIHQSELETRLSRTKLDSTPLNTLYAWTSVLRVFQIQTPPKWIRICYKSIKIRPKINGNPQNVFWQHPWTSIICCPVTFSDNMKETLPMNILYERMSDSLFHFWGYPSRTVLCRRPPSPQPWTLHG